MFCTACGSELSLAAETCPACGHPVVTAAVSAAVRSGAVRASQSGARLHTAEPAAASLPFEPVQPNASASAPASIHAGDLDLPGFPRALAGRVALLTGLVMMADMLLPWVNVNGEGYSPTHVGPPALALVMALVAVVAPPLIPQVRRARLTRAAPFGVGALTLGFSGALWLFTGPLAATLTSALMARFVFVAAPERAISIGSSPISTIQISPAIGLYLFMLGACTLLVVGFQTLFAHES